MSSEEVKSTENLVIHNDGSELLTLEFTNDLPAEIGNIVYEIEVFQSGEGWNFKVARASKYQNIQKTQMTENTVGVTVAPGVGFQHQFTSKTMLFIVT